MTAPECEQGDGVKAGQQQGHTGQDGYSFYGRLVQRYKRSILPVVMLNLFQHLAVNAVDRNLSYPNAFIGYLLLFYLTTKRWRFPITTLGNDKTYNALQQTLKQVQGDDGIRAGRQAKTGQRGSESRAITVQAGQRGSESRAITVRTERRRRKGNSLVFRIIPAVSYLKITGFHNRHSQSGSKKIMSNILRLETTGIHNI